MSTDEPEAFVPLTMTGRELHNMAADLFPGSIAAAGRLGRAVGWREAIEALRIGEPYPSMSRVHVSAFVRMQLADFLESLAPKETDQPRGRAGSSVPSPQSPKVKP